MLNRRWTEDEISSFSNKLYNLLDSGLPILSSLQLLIDHSKPRQKKACLRLKEHLEQGGSFSNGLKSIGYPAFLCTLVSAAELHGHMADTLQLSANHYRKQSKRKQKLRKALSYPILVLCSSFITLLIIMYGVFPQFLILHHTFQIELPEITMKTVGFFDFLDQFQLWFYGSSLMLLILLIWLTRAHPISLERFYLCMPFLSGFFKLRLAHFFCLQTGLMMEGGITIVTICRLFSREGHWIILRRTFIGVEEDLLQGRRLFETLRSIPWLLPIVTETVRVAESSGTVGVSLIRLADQLEEEIDQFMETFSSRLETAILVAVGIVVLLVMLTLFVPLFELMNHL
jgi:type II secretory pathway component PulF